jgi:hypothetical protein
VTRAIAVVSETVAVQACHLSFPDAENEGGACFDGASARLERVREDLRGPVA